MKIVVFGLTVSSSWGNGHATLWRGWIRALTARRHHVVFFERDAPYYAEHRDLRGLPHDGLRLYRDWADVRTRAGQELRDADVAIVTSYCPDGPAAAALVLDSAVRHRVFYDLDTPVTLARLARGETVPYLPANGLADFDLVLSCTGGHALDALRDRLGARAVAALYGSVDPAVHRPVAPDPRFQSALSHLGTYAADRRVALDRFFLRPAAARPAQRFVLAGAQYPADFPWRENLWFIEHVPPADHPALFAASAFTLNITRAPMAALGFCPSARLFEAAACGCPVISDAWPGLERFYTPGEEILVARSTDDVLAALDLDAAARLRLARRSRERTLSEHTADARAQEMERLFST